MRVQCSSHKIQAVSTSHFSTPQPVRHIVPHTVKTFAIPQFPFRIPSHSSYPRTSYGTKGRAKMALNTCLHTRALPAIPTPRRIWRPVSYTSLPFPRNNHKRIVQNAHPLYVQNSVVNRNQTVCCAAQAERTKLQPVGNGLTKITTVYKFGGSSVASAERMLEVADIICSFPDQLPCVVLSAMGKTTNRLLEAGSSALDCNSDEIENLDALKWITNHHLEAADALGVDEGTKEAIRKLLVELTQLLTGISMLQECSLRTRDNLVSFGERMSTRLFAGLLRANGVPARQCDAWDIGFVSTDEFGSADILYDKTLAGIQEALGSKAESTSTLEVPVVTGFVARGELTGAITTLGRGGSDLTATLIGAALGVGEVQVWKDVDGVLTCDPRIVADAQSVPLLTFNEAAELAHFGAQVLHPQAMKPAKISGSMAVRVKNSYNRMAPGTLIQSDRDFSASLLSSIVLKRHVTMVDIVSTKMVGQYGFLAKVFDMFKQNEISVDVVATSEVSVSITLDVKRLWMHRSVEVELKALALEFQEWADVSFRENLAIVSLICNVGKSSVVLERVFKALGQEGINVQMMSQGASKTNISLIIDDKEAARAAQAIHAQFF